MALSETNVDSKAPRKVCIFFTAGGQYSRCGQTMQLMELSQCEHYENTFKYVEKFITKTGKFSEKKNLIYSCSEHKLWVLVRMASARQF